MYYDKLSDLGIKLTRRYGQEKTKCPQCHDGRKNKNDRSLSVNITTGEYKCFTGETRVLTSEGAKSIFSILGKMVLVLNSNRDWVPVVFRSYGKAELYRVSLSRNQRKKEIYTTANHEWFAHRIVKRLKTTQIQGKALISNFPRPTQSYTEIPEAVAAGFIFGDGTIYNKHRKNQYSRAVMIGDKDSFMRRYYSKGSINEKVGYCTASGYPPEYKTNIPSIHESVDYLMSWLSGYFAADGDVCVNGVACINSSNYSNLIQLRDICTKCGIGTYGISTYNRLGGISKKRRSNIYRLSFVSETIIPQMFLNPEHNKRVSEFEKECTKTRWSVTSIEKTGRVEEVFCCEEPETHTFTLEDNILTSNCHNSCGFQGNVRSLEKKKDIRVYEKPSADVLKNIQLRDKVVAWFAKRAITEATLNKFMIFCKEEWMPQTNKKENCICFPYFRDGSLINIKFRDGAKNFRMVKDAELIFFNLQSIGDKKKVIVTEGEIDCMAGFQVGFGHDPLPDPETGEITNPNSEYAILSVPNGASKGSQKIEYLDNCSDYFVALDEIVLATDGDEAGQMLREELLRRFGVERCRFVIYPNDQVVPTQNNIKRRCKDLNEVLLYLGEQAVEDCINNAQSIPVEGVHFVEDIFASMLDNFRRGVIMGSSTHMGEMDEYFRWKIGNLILVTGYANWGKTTFIIYCMLVMAIEEGWKWAIFSPENYPANDFYDDIVEMYCGRWLENMGEREYTEACNFINEHFFYVYPEDEHDLNSIHEKFRYLVLKKGVRGVMIDPWNQLDHIQKAYQREDQYLSQQLKDVKRFALHNQVCYVVVAHPKTPTKDQDKSYPPVDMYDISGGAMWGNKADEIISYYRPNYHVDKADPWVKIFIQKVKRKRTGGKPGDFDLKLNWPTKRFINPTNGLPFCDPHKQNTGKVDLDQIRLPWKDDRPTTDDDLEEEAPF